MLLKLAGLSMIATTAFAATTVTAHMEQVGPTRVQWVYDSGANAGYVCAVVQQDGAAYDTYLPAIWPKPIATAALTALPWLRYSNQNQAMSAVNAYCPLTPGTKKLTIS